MGKDCPINGCQLHKYVAVKGGLPLPCHTVQDRTSGEVPPSGAKWNIQRTISKQNTKHPSWRCYTNGNSSLQSNVLKLGKTVQLYISVGDARSLHEHKLMPQRAWRHPAWCDNSPSGGPWECPNWKSLNIYKDDPSLTSLQPFTFLARNDTIALMKNKLRCDGSSHSSSQCAHFQFWTPVTVSA